MSLTITHAKVTSGTIDDAVEVDLGDWNDNHTITGSVAASEITSGAALTKTDDTNVTLTLGGTPTTALLTATSVTVGWTGTLAASRGGTGISSLGTGVATALGINVGSAGAFVTFNGALGTPSSGTLTSATGLPISTGLTGAGTGVLTALAVNVGSAGAFVTFNGALGTPSSGTLTSCTGLPVSTGISGLGSNVATFLGTPSSANLASAVTDETGSGALVFGTSPTITTPNIVGTTTNNNASAGSVGEFMASESHGGSATVTISNASPAVITETGHGMTAANNNNSVVNFTTSGGLPTGLSTGTNYYITIVDANTYKVSTSVANAIAGTFVNTSSAGSGTHTAVHMSANLSTGANADFGGLSLTAGDWEIEVSAVYSPAGTTNITYLWHWHGTVSATAPGVGSVNTSVFYRLPGGAVPGGLIGGIPTSMRRISLSGTTTYFASCQTAFTVSTNQVYGIIRARRVR